MKSKTSFSKGTPFVKDITRYLPLWAVYFVGGLLIILNVGDSQNALMNTLEPFAVINLIYAALCALTLFGDLFNARLCNALHAMPLRREHWYLSHVASGLCFSLVPHLVAMCFVMPMQGELWYLGLVWLVVMALQFLFFFGLAVFACFCAGNRIGAAVLYALFNGFSMLIKGFLYAIYLPRMPGVVWKLDFLDILCPIYHLVGGREYVIIESTVVREPGIVGYGGRVRYTFEGFGEAWGYLWILGAIGLGLLVLSLILYRRRRLETAGDFMALRPLEPLFSLVFTLSCAMVWGLMGTLITDESQAGTTVFLLIGLILGYFVSEMLLRRTPKVFNKRTFVTAALALGFLSGSLILTDLDAFGVVRYVPKEENVAAVSIQRGHYSTNNMDIGPTITDPQIIRSTLALHEAALNEEHVKNYALDYGGWVFVSYKLKDGRVVLREYEVRVSLLKSYNALFNTPSILLAADSPKELAEDLRAVYFSGMEYSAWLPEDSKAFRSELAEALWKDAQAGHLVDSSFLEEDTNVVGRLELNKRRDRNNGRMITLFLSITEDCENTWKVLEPYLEEITMETDEPIPVEPMKP